MFVSSIKGGRDNDTLVGGPDGDTFVFYPGDGDDVIEDFEILLDEIILMEEPVINTISTSTDNTDTVISYNNGDSITLKGFNIFESDETLNIRYSLD